MVQGRRKQISVGAAMVCARSAREICYVTLIYIYINFNDNRRPGDPYVKTTDKYIQIHTC